MFTLLLVWLAFKASASQIVGYGNTSGDYGGEASYKCKLNNEKDVLQVTWQRIFKDDVIENLAAYSKRFGSQVNEQYREKVFLTETSLQSTSITVKNLTWADESCYVCSFNAYPDGSKRHQTCLKVQGVSQVQTQVHAPTDAPEDKDMDVVFSCSAMGKPAPQIHWDYSPHAAVVDQSQTSMSTNSDHTFTRSTNITLQLSPNWDGHIDCLVNPGIRGQRRETIQFSRQKTTGNEAGTDTYHILVIVTTIVLLMILIVITVTFFFAKRSKHQRRTELYPL